MTIQRRHVRIFISYAHSSCVLAKQLIESLTEYMKPSKHFEYHFWHDVDLTAGEKWDERIKEELAACDCGVLLVSAAFLNSKYISETELPAIMDAGKPVFPVLLSKVNFEHHNLAGLKDYQIFRFMDSGFSSPRSFGEMRGRRKVDFVDRFFVELEDRLIKFYDGK